MIIHAIVDFSFLYYKYKFLRMSGRIKRLIVERNGKEKDVSEIYYSIKEVEKIRKDFEAYGHDVVMSICFDSKSKRKDGETSEAKEYKANRHSVLVDEDYENILEIQSIFDRIGYNTYKVEGIEADDLVHELVKYKNEFGFTFIYTPDADLLVNVQNKVVVERYKTGQGYTRVYLDNFSEILSKEFKCTMPYNAITLYKCTCGDKSDEIKGIPKFGPKAFDKLVNYLTDKGVDWSVAESPENTQELIEMSRGYLTDEQIEKALACLDLVRFIDLSEYNLKRPVYLETKENRNKVYMELGFNSLIEK